MGDTFGCQEYSQPRLLFKCTYCIPAMSSPVVFLRSHLETI